MRSTGGPIFGYAKPVPYNPMYFKNLRKGEIITGFAGPALEPGAGARRLGARVDARFRLRPSSVPFAQALYLIGYTLALTNLVLMFFNLIPIPPLDGSSIVPIFLSGRGRAEVVRAAALRVRDPLRDPLRRAVHLPREPDRHRTSSTPCTRCSTCLMPG